MAGSTSPAPPSAKLAPQAGQLPGMGDQRQWCHKCVFLRRSTPKLQNIPGLAIWAAHPSPAPSPRPQLSFSLSPVALWRLSIGFAPWCLHLAGEEPVGTSRCPAASLNAGTEGSSLQSRYHPAPLPRPKALAAEGGPGSRAERRSSP